mmetsp:Transcript_8345/g.20528  ORF Transcript_8345/g.20528 Transcript_8345/m.20528 type:complete len:249 (-) Transcript_8345:766-1512(-)
MPHFYADWWVPTLSGRDTQRALSQNPWVELYLSQHVLEKRERAGETTHYQSPDGGSRRASQRQRIAGLLVVQGAGRKFVKPRFEWKHPGTQQIQCPAKVPVGRPRCAACGSLSRRKDCRPHEGNRRARGRSPRKSRGIYRWHRYCSTNGAKTGFVSYQEEKICRALRRPGQTPAGFGKHCQKVFFQGSPHGICRQDYRTRHQDGRTRAAGGEHYEQTPPRQHCGRGRFFRRRRLLLHCDGTHGGWGRL